MSKEQIAAFRRYKKELVDYITVTNLPETSKKRIFKMICKMEEIFQRTKVK